MMKKKITRRDFIKLSAGSAATLGLLLFNFPNFEKLLAAAVSEVPVIWLQGGGCSGCSVSVLNSLSPKIQDVLVSQVIPGQHVSLRFHPTVMAASGELAMQALDDAAMNPGGYLLVMEGAIATKDDGVYCELGERDGHGVTILEHITSLGRDAMAVIALGACATHGGIPAGSPNPTGSKGVMQVFEDYGIDTPVINLPGCPPHPDWFVGTVASVLLGGLESVEVDSMKRPVAFYGKLIHDNCPRRGYFDAGQFAKKFSEPYCLYELGCKGPVTYADCPIRHWNSGTSWCIGASSPCIGCASMGFPDEVSPVMSLAPLYSITPPSTVPGIDDEPEGLSAGEAAAIGAVSGIAAGAAGAAAVNIMRQRGKKEGESAGQEE
jgi:hydrogenase small subunit